MRRVFIILVAVLLTANVFAQTPQKMSYQAVVRNSDNKLVKNQKIGMQISILESSADGTVVYAEKQTPTTNTNGLVSIEVGSGTVESGNFASIKWGDDTYFIKTETDPTGGTNYTITGTSQLLSVPYALYAKNAESVNETDPQFTAWDKNYNDLTNKPINVSDFNNDIGYLTNYNETQNLRNVLTRNNSANFFKITELANPVNAQDAATKAYVDSIKNSIKLEIYAEMGVTDSRDGNHYNAVKIGNQIWMSENLKYLPEVHSNSEFASQGESRLPAYGVYDYDGSDVNVAKQQTNYETFGVLYNWYVVKKTNVCPDGWHVPTTDEWTELENYLIANGYNYDDSNSGNKIAKSLASKNLWRNSSFAGAVGNDKRLNNASGFTGLPSGSFLAGSSFIHEAAFWWSSTDNDYTSSNARRIEYSYKSFLEAAFSNKVGLSIRCVKD